MRLSEYLFYVAVVVTAGAATGTALYFLERFYWFIVRRKVENTGNFRDDRRMNDWR
jgi:hypothetical protein